ncbi:peptidase S8/S53 domain-containing protein [Thamnocephalis sphaerospora]|uniref:Peptidase S8/S53 domain-containing protein n=1 Tax=Thamnocephalis sphaerospora TaxID=78915 RepID=A0A4P9XT49_9FUNG|nr:peptidase S8/S53 domain-containing protein [Thamnocephalis sphaerospora]|eukprot:RKP09338.1 peptidase S8/S53 domain-containing protein [Thamnocephalis sphaerospora]
MSQGVPLGSPVHGVTGTEAIHETYGLTGQGVRVAVVDSGVDYKHPGLEGWLGPGCRISFGYDLVDNDADPYDDCDGHGTHVMGILAANDTRVQIIAPGATFGAYQRAQVINISIGFPDVWPDYPLSHTAQYYVERGVVIVAAAGNQGVAGLWRIGSSASAPGVIAACSFDASQYRAFYFTISGVKEHIDYFFSPPAGVDTDTDGSVHLGQYPIVSMALLEPDNTDACQPIQTRLDGRVVMVKRGGICTTDDKADNARNAGAAAVIVYNNVMIFKGHNALPSYISPWGLSPDFNLKPDVCGLGGFILSTFPLSRGGYATLSGTSRAAPYIAGVAALYLQMDGTQQADAVRRKLMNSARPYLSKPSDKMLTSAAKQGAGLSLNGDAYHTQPVSSTGSIHDEAYAGCCN